MPTIKRDLNVAAVSLAAGEERSWTVPVNVNYLEFNSRGGTQIRLSNVSGGTNILTNYMTITSWWGLNDLQLPSGTVLYFQCATANEYLEIAYSTM